MNVIYTGNLSATTLSPNTIYVVTNTVSTGSTNITTDNCDAIISNQATGTTFYSTTQLTNGMFYNYGKKYDIWDNIAINGT